MLLFISVSPTQQDQRLITYTPASLAR